MTKTNKELSDCLVNFKNTEHVLVIASTNKDKKRVEIFLSFTDDYIVKVDRQRIYTTFDARDAVRTYTDMGGN